MPTLSVPDVDFLVFPTGEQLSHNDTPFESKLIHCQNCQRSKADLISFENRRTALPPPPEPLPAAEGGRGGNHDQGDDDGGECG